MGAVHLDSSWMSRSSQCDCRVVGSMKGFVRLDDHPLPFCILHSSTCRQHPRSSNIPKRKQRIKNTENEHFPSSSLHFFIRVGERTFLSLHVYGIWRWKWQIARYMQKATLWSRAPGCWYPKDNRHRCKFKTHPENTEKAEMTMQLPPRMNRC